MKKILLILFLIFGFAFTSVNSAAAYTNVRGYYRSNGTYVRPYVRSNANGLRYDNYSYKSYQPAYNPSYYSNSYSSEWNTPSYTTDSDYYAGKSIYDSYHY